MKKRIIQLVAGYSNGDAISNEARSLRNLFQSWGHESLITCESARILPELMHDAVPLENLRDNLNQDDILFLHLSIGSIVNEIFPALPGRKVILYHNITPGHYFSTINPKIQRALDHGRTQLRNLSQAAEIVMADSNFNAQELTDAGYRDVSVFPLLLHWGSLSDQQCTATLRQWSDGPRNILFVGRCAPNKKIEDLLFTFHYYQQYVDPDSRLIHVGSFAGTEKYHYLLKALQRKLNIQHIEMPGMLEQHQLNAAFETADLFLCMSEHEGFCIPLLEAMHRGVPVMAYDAGAVAETMDGAGILFKQKKFDQIAQMMGRVIHDDVLRQTIIAEQHRRIERYRAYDHESQLRKRLSNIL
jgi:glycosyltransferase involved in cell wall biosynthesis